MIPAILLASPLIALLSLPIDFQQKEKNDDIRIKQLLIDCQQKRKAAGSFRMEYDIIVDDKAFRTRDTSTARILNNGADLIRIDFLEKRPESNKTYVRTEKEVYFRFRADVGFFIPRSQDVGFIFRLSQTESSKPSQVSVSSSITKSFVEYMTDPLLLLDRLSALNPNELAVRLRNLDAEWIDLEVTRSWPAPSWLPANSKSFDLFDFRIDPKTGFAMEIKQHNPNGNTTTYTLKSLDRNLAKPVNKEDLLKDLPLEQLERFGAIPTGTTEKH